MTQSPELLVRVGPVADLWVWWLLDNGTLLEWGTEDTRKRASDKANDVARGYME